MKLRAPLHPFFVLVGTVVSVSQLAYAKSFDPPSLKTSIDRLMSVESFYIFDKKGYALSHREPSSLIALPLDFSEQYLNPRVSSELPVRFPLEKLLSSDLRLGAEFDKNLLLVHSDDITLSMISQATGQSLWTRSLPYDRVKPAADRGGEATQFETTQLRQRFLKTWKTLERPRLVSLSENVHSSTRSADHFMVMTHAPDFRLLQIECQKSGEKSCETTRVCNLADPELKKLHLSGFSMHPTKKSFAVVAKGRAEVRFYNYVNCGKSTLSEIWTLPPSLASPASVFLDAENGVWVGTEKVDDFLNASLYRFKR